MTVQNSKSTTTYQCSSPTEKLNIDMRYKQWVLAFNLEQSISANDMDEFLDDDTFIFNEGNNSVTFTDYEYVLRSEIQYSNDLGCNCVIMLGKEPQMIGVANESKN